MKMLKVLDKTGAVVFYTLLVWLVVGFITLTPTAMGEHVPFAPVLQFPWKLLAHFISR